MKKLIKKEERIEVKRNQLFKLNPSQWVMVDRVISPLGKPQEIYAFKKYDIKSKFYCYFNLTADGKKLESIFLCDERNGKDSYIPKKSIKFRADGTTSSITVFNNDGTKTIYFMKTSGLESFKMMREVYVEDVVEFTPEQQEAMLSKELEENLASYMYAES